MRSIILFLAVSSFAAGEDQDPVEMQMHRGQERAGTTYFFVGFDDCVERLVLPNADPTAYCRQRFPRVTAATKQ